MIGGMRRLLPGLAVVATALAVAGPARADVSVQYFTLPPELKGAGTGLEVAPNGTVYFGSGDGFEQTPPIGRLNPALAVPGTSNGITWVTTPDAPGCCAAIFRDLSWSAFDNRLYWTRSDLTVGTVAGDVVTAAQIPNSPWGIAAAPAGGAWMTEYGSSNVAPAYTGNRIAMVEQRARPERVAEPRAADEHLRRHALRRQAEGDRRRARRQAVVRPGRGGPPGLPDRHDRQRRRLHRVPALPDRGDCAPACPPAPR